MNHSDHNGHNGPFALYSSPTVARAVTPLFRCLTPAITHFLSTDATCGGAGKMENTVGWIATMPGTEMLRALYRCAGTVKGTYTHSLDLPCDVPDGPRMGYVR